MSRIARAFKQKETRNKILFTVLILFLYRIGTAIPVPGVPIHAMADQVQTATNSMLMVLNLFAGGALDRMGILALGIMPYITASIIMLLMQSVIPKVRAWYKEGGEGRRQITRITRYLTILIGLIEAIGYDIMFRTQFRIQYNPSVPSFLNDILVVFSLMIGVVIIMWMGELITQHGIGNGMSVIIFTNVVSSVPTAIVSSITTNAGSSEGLMVTIIAFIIILASIPLIVYVERSQRRVPVSSTKQGAMTRYAVRSNSNYIPIPWDISGVYAIIYTAALLFFPSYFAQALPNVSWLQTVANALSRGPISWGIGFLLIIGFCYFQNSFNFNTEDIADNLKKGGQFIKGVRPGAKTAQYLQFIANHLTLFGSVFIGALYVVSGALFYMTSDPLLQAFGGTSILIMISVSMQLMTQIEQQVRAQDPEAVLKRLG